MTPLMPASPPSSWPFRFVSNQPGLPMGRSGRIVVGRLDWLSLAFVSVVGGVMLAVFVTLPAVATVPVMVIVTELFAGSVVIVPVTALPAWLTAPQTAAPLVVA